MDNQAKETEPKQMPGGIRVISPDETYIKQLAEESLQKYLATTGKTEPHKIIRIIKATSQVVAGMKYHIEFEIIPDNEESGDTIICHAIVVEQAWLKKKDIEVTGKIVNKN